MSGRVVTDNDLLRIYAGAWASGLASALFSPDAIANVADLCGGDAAMSEAIALRQAQAIYDDPAQREAALTIIRGYLGGYSTPIIVMPIVR